MDPNDYCEEPHMIMAHGSAQAIYLVNKALWLGKLFTTVLPTLSLLYTTLLRYFMTLTTIGIIQGN